MSKAESKTTTDHRKIQKWVEERGGKPASVKSTMGSQHKPGLLRIHFPGYSGTDALEDISWEDFFKKFEHEKLAFLYQEHTADGELSTFNKLIERPSELKNS